ncbi:MAG: carbonic anhydrase [Thermoanaerobaculia bacterium]
MRKSRVLPIALLILGLVLPLAAQQPPPIRPPLTGDSLWSQLMTGNGSYQSGSLTYTLLDKRREATELKQQPHVTVLSCSDSRVPPELTFHRGVSDLFVVRAAGNVADTFAVASIEYAVVQGYAKLIVVLAHERCGAVEEALKKTDPGTPSLLALVRRIRESFRGIDPRENDHFRAAIIANAKASADYIVLNSTVIGNAVRSHQVKVVVAYYTLKSGKVESIHWDIPPPKK